MAGDWPDMVLSESCRTIYADQGAYIVCNLASGAFLLLSLICAPGLDASCWKFVLVALLLLLSLNIWLMRFRVQVTDDRVMYRNVLGETTLLFSEIRRVEIRAGLYEYSDRFRGNVRLVVLPRSDLDKETIRINLTVFSREDVRWLSTRLEAWKRGRRSRLYRLERELIIALADHLPRAAGELVRAQLELVNLVQRFSRHIEVNLYHRERGTIVWPDTARFPNRGSDVKLASLTFRAEGDQRRQVPRKSTSMPCCPATWSRCLQRWSTNSIVAM
jgi:hypothetical protein